MARIEPYGVFCFNSHCDLIQKTEDMMKNVEYIVKQLKMLLGSQDFRSWDNSEIPVKLIALTESFGQGWPAGIADMDHVEACKRLYNTTVPGPETDALGEAARHTGCYIMGCMEATDPEFMEDRYFNIGFIMNPEGKVIYKRHKSSLFFRERGTCPSDIWDRYVEMFGDDPKALMEALFPVVKTELGNLALAICGEGEKPEIFRAFAMNGAEVIYRGTYMRPQQEQFVLQNRAHAHFNNCYIIAPNSPMVFTPGAKYAIPLGTRSHVFDYRGMIIAESEPTGHSETTLYATIDVEQLRYYRLNSMWQTWVPHLRVEEFILPYQYALNVGGLYPKNLGMDEPPMTRRPHDDLIRWCNNRAVELGIWEPYDGWEPFKIRQDVIDRIERAKARREKK
jgi:predicted amidohydrolase